MSLIIILVNISIGLVGLLAIFLLLEMLAFWWSRQSKRSVSSQALSFTHTPTAFLIPAHNEEAVIRSTLESILPQLKENDEIVVVADNCNDRTADIAAEYNVVVLKRQNAELRGKGYALDHGLVYLKDKTFDVVIMVDADCILEPNARDLLVEEAMTQNRPVQALYLMKNPPGTSTIKQKIAEFTWAIKNHIRPGGLHALNGPCQLTGTGMAFPAELIYQTEIASGCIVEDMKLGLDLATQGCAPIFLETALVTSEFPSDDDASEGQKSRWVHGHLEMIVQYTPKLLLAFVTKRQLSILLMALDLLIPPLILFLVLTMAISLPALLIGFFFGTVAFPIAVIALLALGLSLALAWLTEGKKILSLSELWQGVMAMLQKLSVYSKFFTNKRTEWNKTSRK